MLSTGMYMFDTAVTTWYNRSQFGLPRENMVAQSFNGLIVLAGGLSQLTAVGSSTEGKFKHPGFSIDSGQ